VFTWLARIGLPTAMGVYLDERSVYLNESMVTPFGAMELNRYSEVVEDGDLLARTESLLDQISKTRSLGRSTVAVGIPLDSTLYISRQIQSASKDVSAHVLLREAMRSTKMSVDELVADVVRATNCQHRGVRP